MKIWFLRIIRITVIALPLLCLVTVGISALSNLNLPTRSQVTGRLSELKVIQSLRHFPVKSLPASNACRSAARLEESALCELFFFCI
jgi:hypothetical protein